MYNASFAGLSGVAQSHDCGAWRVFLAEGALRGNCREKQGKTSFSPLWLFLLCRNSLYRFWGVIIWHL